MAVEYVRHHLMLRPIASTSARKELTTWHDSIEDQRRAQRAQALIINQRTWTDGSRKKPQMLVPVVPALPAGTTRRWDVACDTQLYSMGLPPVPHCTPGMAARTATATASLVPGVPCARHVRDHFLSPGEQQTLLAVVERAMRGLFHQGASTSFAPDSKAVKHMGVAGAELWPM